MIDMEELLRGPGRGCGGTAASLATSGPDVAGVSVVATSVRRVTTPAEHFRAYVDRVSGDDSAPGAARVARAVAGESWPRFRDRVVLERAAWLVATTDRTLQDIVADCGFTGYEVFTRAFRREYGALPSQWRRQPTSWLIDAPGDVHFHPPDGLVLPPRRRADSMDLVGMLVEHHVQTVAGLLDRAGRLSEAQLDQQPDQQQPDRPVDGGTLRSTLTGLVDRMEVLVAAVRDTTYDLPVDRHEPLGSLRGRLEGVAVDFVDTVTLLAAGGRLDETFVDAFSPDPTVRSHGETLARILTDADDQRLLALIRLRECDAGAQRT